MGIPRCAGGERCDVRGVHGGRKLHSGLAPEHGQTGSTSISRRQSRGKKDPSRTILFPLNLPESGRPPTPTKTWTLLRNRHLKRCANAHGTLSRRLRYASLLSSLLKPARLFLLGSGILSPFSRSRPPFSGFRGLPPFSRLASAISSYSHSSLGFSLRFLFSDKQLLICQFLSYINRDLWVLDFFCKKTLAPPSFCILFHNTSINITHFSPKSDLETSCSAPR